VRVKIVSDMRVELSGEKIEVMSDGQTYTLRATAKGITLEGEQGYNLGLHVLDGNKVEITAEERPAKRVDG